MARGISLVHHLALVFFWMNVYLYLSSVMGRPWHIWLLMSSLIFSIPFAVSHWLNSPTLGLVVPFSMCPVMMSSSLRQSSIKKQNFCRSCFLDTIWWVGALAEAILSSTTACVWSYLEIKVKTDFFPLGAFVFFEIVSFMLAMIIQLLLPKYWNYVCAATSWV